MHNDLFTIGSLTIHGYGFMIAVGILIGASLSFILAKKHDLNQDVIIDLLLCVVLGGFVGAKLLGLIVNAKYLINGAITLAQALNVTVIYGGIIGAFGCCAVYCWRKKIDFWAYSDLALPCAAITQGIGRIGCLLAGCCYGIPYDGIGAITFTESIFAPNNTPLFPTQIVSSVFMLSYGILSLWHYNHHKIEKGSIGSTYFLVYGIGRTIIEYFRGDAERGFILGMSTSQFISIFFVGVGFGLELYLFKKKEEAGETS